jgi:hypothetical protein
MKVLILVVVCCLSLPAYSQQTAERVTGTKIQYVLLSDASGRTLWPKGLEEQTRVATQFLQQVVTPGSDVGSLVNFSEEFSFEVENSTNPDAIVAKLVRQGHHATALYQAVVSAARWLDEQQSSDSRKIVFVFSDGDDNASQISLQDAIAAIQMVHISVCVIAPSVVEHKRQGKAMKQLASATGGHAYFIPDTDRFDFAPIKRELGR